MPVRKEFLSFKNGKKREPAPCLWSRLLCLSWSCAIRGGILSFKKNIMWTLWILNKPVAKRRRWTTWIILRRKSWLYNRLFFLAQSIKIPILFTEAQHRQYDNKKYLSLIAHTRGPVAKNCFKKSSQWKGLYKRERRKKKGYLNESESVANLGNTTRPSRSFYTQGEPSPYFCFRLPTSSPRLNNNFLKYKNAKKAIFFLSKIWIIQN